YTRPPAGRRALGAAAGAMSPGRGAEGPGRSIGIDGIEDAVPVGQGSYGIVYRATQTAYRRTVAVKIMTAPLIDHDSRRRFERECQALGALSGHPHIVTLHSAGINRDGHAYL